MPVTDNDKNPECQDFLLQKSFNRQVKSDLSATITAVNSAASTAVWGSITGTLSNQGDLNTALGLKAPLISPTFTLTEKTTPIDADSVGIVDSAATNEFKRTTFTNVKAFLKTYFDTLYPAGSGTSTGTNTGDNAVNSLYSGLAASKADVGQTFYIGTTSVAINRAPAALTLAGITLTTPDIGAASADSVKFKANNLRDSKLQALNDQDNAAWIYQYPISSTNAFAGILLSPKGTGLSATLKTRVVLCNTDYIADSTNYESFDFRAGGTNGYSFGTQNAGTGTNRPIWVDATGSYGQATANAIWNIDGSTTLKAITATTINTGTFTRRLISGVTSPLQIEGTGYDTSCISMFCNANSSGIVPILFMGRSRGTVVGSNTVVQSGDLLGAIWFMGSDGTLPVRGATITAYCDGTPGASDMPGRLEFSTTLDGAASSTVRMVINNAGVVTCGTTSGTGTGAFYAGLMTGNSAVAASPPLTLNQTALTSTNFQKVANFGGSVLWRSNGTDPNGALSGTAGDVCINCNTSLIKKCTGGTAWS